MPSGLVSTCCNGATPVVASACPKALGANLEQNNADEAARNNSGIQSNIQRARELNGDTATAEVMATEAAEGDLAATNDLGNAAAATTDTPGTLSTTQKSADPLDKLIQGTRSGGSGSGSGGSDGGGPGSGSGGGTPTIAGTGSSGNTNASKAGGSSSNSANGSGAYSGGRGGGGSGSDGGGGFNFGSLFGGGQGAAPDTAAGGELRFGKGPVGDPLPARTSIDPLDYFDRIPKNASLFKVISNRYSSWWIAAQKKRLTK